MAIDPTKMNWIEDLANRMDAISNGADAYWSGLCRVIEVNVQSYQKRCSWTGLHVTLRPLSTEELTIRVAGDGLLAAHNAQTAYHLRLEKRALDVFVVCAVANGAMRGSSRDWRLDVDGNGDIHITDKGELLNEKEASRRILQPILFPESTPARATKLGQPLDDED